MPAGNAWAFTAVVLEFLRDNRVSWDKVNVNDGAIALGHPIGATGDMLIGNLLDELERRDLATGLVTMCTGGGMATAPHRTCLTSVGTTPHNTGSPP